MGGPDPIWGYRAEDLLNAAILRVDTKAIAQRIAAGQGALNVKTTDAGGTYNPYAAGAAVTIYATGIRNAYDIRLGRATATCTPRPTAPAAGGNTPASPTNPALGQTNITETEWDWLFDVKKGKYYGHPDPARGQYILNDGNVTATPNNPLELPEYPVGTQPGAATTPSRPTSSAPTTRPTASSSTTATPSAAPWTATCSSPATAPARTSST